MRPKMFLVLTLHLLALSCCGQKGTPSYKAPIDFLKYAKEADVGLSYVEIKQENDREITVPYYDIYASKLEAGYASLFILNKQLSEDWVTEAIANPRRECKKEEDYYSSFYVKCEIARLITEHKSALLDRFELYTFFIPKRDLEEPFIEQAEGGKVYNYFPKKGSTFIIYKYEKGDWVVIDQVTQKGDEIPRLFGRQYIERMLLAR